MPDDPFQRLGLPRRFDLDADEIERAYLRRVANVHPDRAAPAEDSAAHAAALNDARRTLLDPERRANALLVLLGGPAASKDLPDGFLVEIMETRQQIEEALASGDPDQRRHWEEWAQRRRRDYIAEVSRRFAALGDPPDAAALADLRATLNAWRYIERLVEQLDPDYDPSIADFGP